MTYLWTSPPPAYGPTPPVQYHALPHQPHYGIVFLTSVLLDATYVWLPTYVFDDFTGSTSFVNLGTTAPTQYADSSPFTTTHHGLALHPQPVPTQSAHHHKKPLRPTTHLQLPLHPHPHLLLRHLPSLSSLPFSTPLSERRLRLGVCVCEHLSRRFLHSMCNLINSLRVEHRVQAGGRSQVGGLRKTPPIEFLIKL